MGGGDRLSAGEEPFADVDEDRSEQRLLARDVPIDGGAADPGGLADVAEGDAVEPALGEQACGGGQQRGTALGL
ncbi:hypothetical protein HR12_23720, partial [Microbacterium sp. SUBG005]